MVIEREVSKEELIGHLRCPHDLACRASMSEYGDEPGSGDTGWLFRCLRRDARSCPHSLFVGSRYLCKCPIRSHLGEILRDRTLL